MSLNSSCRAQNADCAEEDRAALLDFKAGIVQDPTGALQTWTGNDCCRWNGLLCDTHNGRVVNLILNADQGNSREYMSGTLSDSIGNLSYLNKFIIFSWKYIGGTIPSSISGLSALTHLSLDNNNLTCSIPSAIADLPQLQFLSLSGNRLTGAIPQSIGNLQGLTALYLDSNQLSSSIPSSIGNLSRLSVLALNNNLFSDPIPESVGALASLSALDISNNFLTGNVPSSFGNLCSLTKLLASNNRLNGSIPESLGLLGNNLNKTMFGRKSTDRRYPTVIFQFNIPSIPGSIPKYTHRQPPLFPKFLTSCHPPPL